MRSLSGDERHSRRLQVIHLRHEGHTYVEIALKTGLSRTGVFDICSRHDAAGAGAMRDAPNGHQDGTGRLLQPDQEALLRRLIAEHTPDQLALPEPLWTRAGVAQLIEQRCGMRLLDRTTRLYLSRWGYGAQPRLRVADEPAPGAFRQWLADDYPAIVIRARFEAAEIHWGHEDQASRAVRPRKVVGVPVDAAQDAMVLSTATNRGQRHWMGFALAPDADALIGFLHRLTLGQHNKLFLMHGNLRVHGGEALTAWLAEHDEQIEVFCPPGHSASGGPGPRPGGQAA